GRVAWRQAGRRGHDRARLDLRRGDGRRLAEGDPERDGRDLRVRPGPALLPERGLPAGRALLPRAVLDQPHVWTDGVGRQLRDAEASEGRAAALPGQEATGEGARLARPRQ